ncbi:MAG: response regulator transcription factor [Candidatus Marinimicrobia bacterium]|nr:response regulator transcription factor [Candidatus Neomarinimicrobiota bacterium]
MTERNNNLILVVDDEKDIRELVRYNLNKTGLETSGATTGEQALQLARAEHPALMVLDLMLPGIDGLDVCRILKNDATTEDICIIMLTAKGEEADIVRGLEIGADDYITKPFNPGVLTARVKANIRRITGSKGGDGVMEYGELFIHKGRREVMISGKSITLTNSEFQILYFLASNPNWVFTRSQIIEAVKGDNYPVTERSVDFQIVGLRKKLGDVGDTIKTVRGVGYRFTKFSENQ